MRDSPQEKSEGEQPKDPNWPSKGKLEFRNVTMKYRPNTETVLNDISFFCQPGEKIGIVGRTGAGKSTLTVALTRIVEL